MWERKSVVKKGTDQLINYFCDRIFVIDIRLIMNDLMNNDIKKKHVGVSHNHIWREVVFGIDTQLNGLNLNLKTGTCANKMFVVFI